MHSAHGAVAVIRRIVNKNRFLSVKLKFKLLREAGCGNDPFAFQRMIEKKQAEKHHRKGESVRHYVWAGHVANDLRSHITRFACNAEAFTVGCNVIVIADKHIPVGRVNEEIAVVQILIRKAVSVQFAEAVCNVQRCIYRCGQRFKMHLCKQKFRKLAVIARS